MTKQCGSSEQAAMIDPFRSPGLPIMPIRIWEEATRTTWYPGHSGYVVGSVASRKPACMYTIYAHRP